MPVVGLLPERLAVRAKRYFFTMSERQFYGLLRLAVPDHCEVFPNVRLSDLFLTQEGDREARRALLDKHVDFVVVLLPDYTPLVALELDGPSHDTAQQQYRDAVKNTVFLSGGLPAQRRLNAGPRC